MSGRSQDRHKGPPARTLRGIDDALWQAVQDKARARGTSASAVIRALLTHWVATEAAGSDAEEETGPVLAGRLNAPQEAADACSCARCDPGRHLWLDGVAVTAPSRMSVCPQCGNKRCPKGTDHDLACTGSNEPGQPGSRYGR